MANDPAAPEADQRDHYTQASSEEDLSDENQQLSDGDSDEELDEQEQDLPAPDDRKPLKRVREDSSEYEDDGRGDGNDVSDGPPARKRGLEALMMEYAQNDGLDDEEDEDSDESDEDWNPFGSKPSWNCVNCTNPTDEEYTFCSVCGEHRDSGILEQGFMASPDIPGDPSLAADVPLSAEPLQLSEEDLHGATAVGFDEQMLLHFEGKPSPHPERPDRLKAIMAGLIHSGLYPGRAVSFKAREADRSLIQSVHTNHHIDEVELTAGCELRYFTSDTYANADSCQAAKLAAGISADMAVAVASGKIKNGVAVVRPPGHHAESEAIMGFCLHNNAAVAAKAAQAAGAKKILIVDWDVHHGNGTQEIFESDPSVLYVSVHRYDGGHFYPGTGGVYEVGTLQGSGYSVNIPWSCGNVGDSDYIAAFTRIIMPLAYQFAPDMTIISAGFDAAAGDPLGGCQVSPAGYAHMTSILNCVSQGRMLIVLEGGYNLRSISSSLAACVRILLGESPPPLVAGIQPSEAGLAVIAEVSAVQARYWSVLGHQEIQVHPIMSGEEEEDEMDSLADGRGDMRLNTNSVARETGEARVMPYFPTPSIASNLPSPSYPPGAASPQRLSRIPSPRNTPYFPSPPHPAFAPPLPEPTSSQPAPPPRAQANPLPSNLRMHQVNGMVHTNIMASPVHQSIYHPSPAHPSTYHHPSPSRGGSTMTSPPHPGSYFPSPAYQNHPQSIFHPPTASPQHHTVPYVTSTVHLKASSSSGHPPTVAPLIPRPLNPQPKRSDGVRSPSVQPATSTGQVAPTMRKSSSYTSLQQIPPAPAIAEPPSKPSETLVEQPDS